MLSIVVPAHDEEALLGTTLRAIHEAGDGLDEPYEVIVVDDASTDRTAEVAAAAGARVVPVGPPPLPLARTEPPGYGRSKSTPSPNDRRGWSHPFARRTRLPLGTRSRSRGAHVDGE
jgi:glycosyltransferase involved in cell wall biosynthesis